MTLSQGAGSSERRGYGSKRHVGLTLGFGSGYCSGGSGPPLLALLFIYSQNSVNMFYALFFTRDYFKI